MKTKLILTLGMLLLTAPFLLAQTSHVDYATMEIKDCNACHKASDVPLNHGSFWVTDHRLYAEKQPHNCKDCHKKSFCVDCHYGGGIDDDLNRSQFGPSYMPKSHVTDWREIHPIKALDDTKSCFRCHNAVQFCQACHNKFNPNDLMVKSHRRGWSDLEVKAGGPKHEVFNTAQCPTCHPNSLVPANQWAPQHAQEARRNLSSCQACHSDGAICLKCHSAVTGLRVNPHPKNWDKISGRLSSASKNSTCIKCHR
ncbi:MAG TPA: hypothetical protein VEI96_07865 [Thermodesulfovibrionales bacterium]|nr:hypothetical protein [Thermodesulfovibrionales bacterium]